MATQDSEAQFIDIDDVRIGTYVYVDLGWIKHPFALNSFKITARDQIDTLIKLGVKRIRWSPDKSDPEPGSEDATAPKQNGRKVGAGETASAVSPAAETAAIEAGTTARQAIAEAVAAEAAALAEERRQRRDKLDAQRESLEICEREFTTASRAYRQVIDQVSSHPESAREQVTQMVGGMVSKMLAQEETAIRLLSESVGERASQHSINVSVISLLLGKTLGLDAAQLDILGGGALLHDIGLIALPERLRWLDSQFSSAERRLYQEHVAHGVAIGSRMKLPPEELAIIAQHHELADGRGYPQQLSGEQISPLARIVALVNLYDNLCNPGNPSQAITPHEALALIFAQMRNQFDNKVLMPFIRMMGVYPPGSVVELSDGRMALVVSVNAARPLKPNVVVYEPRVPRDEALVEDLEQTQELGIRRSLKPLQLPKAAFDYLSPRQRICYFFERARNAREIEFAT
ncbi:MAG: HD domain-containing phosphohydrolase [Pseudomonadota bacterium]